MIDEALKRAGIILGETKWCMADLQDAMLRFADERLEKAADAVETRAFAAHAAHVVRSFKSTPPPPPETREQRLERALRELSEVSVHGTESPREVARRVRCRAVEALQEHGSTSESSTRENQS